MRRSATPDPYHRLGVSFSLAYHRPERGEDRFSNPLLASSGMMMNIPTTDFEADNPAEKHGAGRMVTDALGVRVRGSTLRGVQG
jgi:hypothetical protein